MPVKQPAADAATPALALDVESDERGFPYREIAGLVKRRLPGFRLPDHAQRRDAVMKAWWRQKGKTTVAFELLCDRIAASDFLMARNGHCGYNGRPFPLAWVFSTAPRDGQLRADKILAGDYDNDRMAFVLEKQKREAGPKLTKVTLVGVSRPQMVDLEEKLPDGRKRYRVDGTHVVTGLPDVSDRKC